MFSSICLLLLSSAHAATWTVASDGSADFESIQDAIDAASKLLINNAKKFAKNDPEIPDLTDSSSSSDEEFPPFVKHLKKQTTPFIKMKFRLVVLLYMRMKSFLNHQTWLSHLDPNPRWLKCH